MAEKATELSIVMRARNEAAKVFNQVKGQLKDVNAWVQKNRESLLTMGRAFLIVGAIGTGFLAAGIAQAADFEQSIANVKAISNATAEEQKLLGDAALEMGAKTSKSASEAAQAQLFLAQAGLTVKQNIEALPGVIRLAEAANSDLAFTTQLTVATLSQFNLVAGESARVANVLAAASANSLANLEKLAFALRQVGPVASALGLSLEETVAVLSQLFDAGLRGEQAGTALRAILLGLTAPAGEAAEVIADLGIKVKDTAGKMRPLVEILNDFGEAGTTTEQAVRIFGREAVAAFEKLKGTGSIIEAMTNAITGTDEATRQAKARLDSFTGSATLLSSSIEVLVLTALLPLLPVLQQLIDLINQVVLFLNAMPVTLKIIIVLLGGMASGLFVLVGALALFAPGIATLIAALRSLAVTLPIVAASATTAGGAFAFAAGSTSAFSVALVNLRRASLALIASPLAPWILGITILGTLALTAYNRWFKSIEKSTDAIKENQKAIQGANVDLQENNEVVKTASELAAEQEKAVKKLAAAYGKLGIKNAEQETLELNEAFKTIKESGTASGREITDAYDALQKKLEQLKPVQANLNDEFIKAVKGQVAALQQKRDIIQQTFQLEIQALAGVRASINDNFTAQEKLLGNIKTIGDEIKASQKVSGDFEFELSLKGLSGDEKSQRELMAAQQALRETQNLAADERVIKLNEIIQKTQSLALAAQQGSIEEILAADTFRRAQKELIAAQKQKQAGLESEKEALIQTNSQLRIVETTLTEMLQPLSELDERLRSLKAVLDTADFDRAKNEAEKLRDNFEDIFSEPIKQIILVVQRRVAGIGEDPVGIPVDPDASFAHGIRRVPRDMPALIHKDEAVLSRSEANKYRSGNGGGGVRDINIIMPPGAVEITPEVVRDVIAPELERVGLIKGS